MHKTTAHLVVKTVTSVMDSRVTVLYITEISKSDCISVSEDHTKSFLSAVPHADPVLNNSQTQR